MAEIVIKVTPEKSRKITGFTRELIPNLIQGFHDAGAILEADMKKKVSGTGRHLGPSDSPYPGIGKTKQLRSTMNAQVTQKGGEVTLLVGPNIDNPPYPLFLEIGTSKMKPYSFLGPTIDDKGDEALDRIVERIVKPLDR